MLLKLYKQCLTLTAPFCFAPFIMLTSQRCVKLVWLLNWSLVFAWRVAVKSDTYIFMCCTFKSIYSFSWFLVSILMIVRFSLDFFFFFEHCIFTVARTDILRHMGRYTCENSCGGGCLCRPSCHYMTGLTALNPLNTKTELKSVAAFIM